MPPSDLLLKPAILKLLDDPLKPQHFRRIQSLIITSGVSQSHHAAAVRVAEFLSTSDNPSSAYRTLKQIHGRHSILFLLNTLISGYAKSKLPKSGLAVYKLMVADGFSPDKYTFPIVLKSCMKFSGIWEARQLHVASLKVGFPSHLHLQNALVHLYVACGLSADARNLFDDMPVRDVVSWTGLISGYVKCGLFIEALSLFASMDVEPNGATLVNALVACGRAGYLDLGRITHGLIFKCQDGLSVVFGNPLIDMYAKCGLLADARLVFEELPQRDLVSWTSFISGLVKSECPKEALDAFRGMGESGLEPDNFVLSAVLAACASLGALDTGRWIHGTIDSRGIEWDVHIGTAIVDMYAKCGDLGEALRVFHQLPLKNISTWNALLGGLAQHGRGRSALQYYDTMIREGFVPNEVSFVAILGACSHSGFVWDGRRYFAAMTETYNIAPRIEHYGRMVDLLGRAGLVEEAYGIITEMPMPPDVSIWGAMLSACRDDGNVGLSRRILGRVLELEGCDSGVYVLLSNIFATSDMWGEVTEMRRIMRERGIKKEPGSSIIEVNGVAHEFLVGKSDQSQNLEILLVLYFLSVHARLDIM